MAFLSLLLASQVAIAEEDDDTAGAAAIDNNAEQEASEHVDVDKEAVEVAVDPAEAAEQTGQDESREVAEDDDERLQRLIDERVQQRIDELLDEGILSGPIDIPPPRLEFRGDYFTKFLSRNNMNGGCLSLGNPAPTGDNFSGDNGICSTLSLSLIGHVSDRVEAGARLQSRYGAEWATWWENGDRKSAPDATGESLGMNHAAYIRLRGLYLSAAPPIPFIDNVRLGSSDLSMFNPWTIGKIRYTERDNARGIFIDGGFGPWLSYTFARVALPKLWASANYNTGINDALVENPFWERDAAYAYKLTSEWDWFRVEQISSYILDEEGDTDDPDAFGSTNTIDLKDGVVVTNPRYQNATATLEVSSNWIDWLGLRALGGYSYSKTDDEHVFNSVSGAQGFSPVPMGEHHGYAVVARADVFDPFDWGTQLHLEYFNIGRDWVSVFAARREADVLLTDGFLDGQVPTLNIANEFQDFTEPFYESAIGWHGLTAVGELELWDLALWGEGTFIEYNTDTGEGSLDVDETYPDFLFPDGMTDTMLYSFANTNDRGRDPRSVYHRNQNRRTVIGVGKADYALDISDFEWFSWVPEIRFHFKHKTIWDVDLRDLSIEADDYQGWLFFNRGAVQSDVTDELSVAVGAQVDYWLETHRSGDIIAGTAVYPDYSTLRSIVFTDIRYIWGGINFWYHAELVNKDVNVSDSSLSFSYRNVLRSIAMVSAAF